MGLGNALVDRARRVRNASTSTGSVPVHGGWFRARLFSAPLYDVTNVPPNELPVTPQLLYEGADENGDPVRLNINDEVEVDSEDLGRTIYGLVADPAPIRKRSGLLGFKVALKSIGVAEISVSTDGEGFS